MEENTSKKRSADDPASSSAPIAKRTKKKATLALTDMPNWVHDPEAENKREQEEIEKHGGRVRTLPVIAGHWPTHIYLSCKIPILKGEIPNTSNLGSESLSELAKSMSKSTTAWTFNSYQDLHISLARTFSLRHSEIQEFCKQLGEAVRALKCGPIDLSFDRWKLLVNDTKMTSFASLVVSQNTEQITSIIAAVDSLMERFGHPKYYEEGIVHASIAWTPSNIMETLSTDNVTPKEGIVDPKMAIEPYIRHVFCKVGKILHSWPLD